MLMGARLERGQFLGIGRNGHLAFHEPGVPWDRGYHVAELSASTRDDAKARFLPAAVPMRAITAGIATCIEKGTVTSTTLLANMPATRRALAWAALALAASPDVDAKVLLQRFPVLASAVENGMLEWAGVQ